MKILFVLIDGCRVDSLRQAHTPTLNSLMEHGCFTGAAKTVRPSITLPVLLSIHTSTAPARHGQADNVSAPDLSGLHTLAQRLREAGRTVGFFYNWEPIKQLNPPGTMDLSVFMDNYLEPGGDEELVALAGPIIADRRPDLAWLYLGCVDEEGHRSGYGSAPYLASLEGADRALGEVLGLLEQNGGLDDYAVVVQADHGGEGFDHEDPHPSVMNVPWVAWGKGVRRGVLLDEPVSVLDTVPTLAALLGIEPHPSWEGRVLDEIFE